MSRAPVAPAPQFKGALCAKSFDDALFFAYSEQEQAQAAAICNSGCPAVVKCLSWGLAHEEFGVWGGMTERQRRTRRRRRGIEMKSPQAISGLLQRIARDG